jgi:hypothetical protein
MGSKFFGNQDSEQILAHLRNFLRRNLRYNLKVDPLGIHFEISEAIQRNDRLTNQEQFSHELRGMSQKQRRLFNLKRRRSKPKLRSVKKGRTVSLRGSLVY